MSWVPRVRVIVINWNGAWYSRRCLRSLLATDYPATEMELVLVDNGSIDGSGLFLAREFPEVRHLQLEENLGFAEGCNRAMRDRSGVDYVALVNNDAVVEPGWLRPLVDALERDGRAGAAAARMVLEPSVAAITIHATQGVTLERVEVDGLDVTGRLVSTGIRVEADLAWPLDVRRHVESTADLWVPAGPDAELITVTCAGSGGVTLLSGGSEAVAFGAPGSGSAHLAAERTELLNGLGTGLTDLGEGFDRGFGRPVAAGLPDGPVDGFCGGGVLLRSAMLDDVGLFDPGFFAYYEDTDLSWRARGNGWGVVVVPDSIVRHAFGAAGGSRSPSFWFLDRRNWILTTLRNGDRRRRSAVLAAAREATWRSVRANLIGRIRRGWRPRWRLTATWLRIWAAVLGWSAAGILTRRGSVVGARATDRVRSRWQPRAAPAAPGRRPGGPQLAYIDVTDTLASGWRAGIQRVVVGFVRELPAVDPRIEVVPVVWSTPHGRFRRANTAEVAALLGPVRLMRSQPSASAAVGLRRAIGALLRTLRLREPVRWMQRSLAVARTPRHDRDLLLDRLEPGSVLLEVDAVWNQAEPDRRRLYERLRAGDVAVIPFIHDVLPVEHPEWFVPPLVGAFGATVLAQMEVAADVLVASPATAAAVRSVAARHGIDPPAIHPIRLASGVGGGRRGEASRSLLDLRDRPYVLVVGTVEPRKNQVRLLDAIDHLARREQLDDLVLVVVGREGWQAADVAARLRSGGPAGSVVWIEDADDEVLEELYVGARLVLAPSLAEGFGLPAAEAVRLGVPVVASPSGAPGVESRLIARVVDPDDTVGWAEAIRELANDSAPRRAALDALSGARVPSWSDVATDVVDVILRCTQRRPTGQAEGSSDHPIDGVGISPTARANGPGGGV